MPEQQHQHEESNAEDTAELVMKKIAFYWRELVLAVGLIVITVVIYGYILEAKASAEKDGWNAIAQSLIGKYNPDEIAKELQSAADLHKTTTAAGYAYLKEMAALANSKDADAPEKAIAAAKAFLAAEPNHYFAPQVHLEMARMLLRSGNTQDAAVQLKLAETANVAYLKSEIMLMRAQILSLQEGKEEEAAQQYRMLLQSTGAYTPGHILEAAKIALAELDDRIQRDAGTIIAPAKPIGPAPAADDATETKTDVTAEGSKPAEDAKKTETK